MKLFRRHATAIFYVALILCIAAADVAVGIRINLWLLYMVPMGLATWNLGIKTGWAFFGLSVVVLFSTAFLFGYPQSSQVYLVLSYISKTIAYCVVVFLLGELRKKQVERIFMPSRSPE